MSTDYDVDSRSPVRTAIVVVAVVVPDAIVDAAGVAGD